MGILYRDRITNTGDEKTGSVGPGLADVDRTARMQGKSEVAAPSSVG